MFFSSTSMSASAGPSSSRAVASVSKSASHVQTTVPRAVLPVHPPVAHVAIGTPATAVDNFFGAESVDSHSPPSNPRVSMPPPYAPYGHKIVEVEQGVYSVEEPPTLARMLFFYGFLFFPFWLAGIYVLFSPLLPTSDWEAGKTEDEKAHLLRVLRETEKKWARRCLLAMFGLTVTVLLLVVIIKFAVLGRK